MISNVGGMKKGPLVEKEIPNRKVMPEMKGGKQMGKINMVQVGVVKKENGKMEQITKGVAVKTTNMTQQFKKDKIKQIATSKPNVQQKVQMISKVNEPPMPMKQTKKVQKTMKSTMMSRFQQSKNLELIPCHSCGRTFVPQSLKRHEKICKKVFINKRKEFNSVKQRIVSKQQVKLMKMSRIADTNQKPQNKKISALPLWKQQSLALRLAMKQVRGGKKSQEQLAFQQKEKKLVQKNMFKCKGCSRFFNDEAGKRHESFCLEKLRNMPNKMKKR